MNLEQLEALAFGEDRAAALGQLLPGSEEHDYWTVVHLQQRGELDAAQKLLERWESKHGYSERCARLGLRQVLLLAGGDLAKHADDLAEAFDATLDDEPESAREEQPLPSALGPHELALEPLLRKELAARRDLRGFSDLALPWLLERLDELDAAQKKLLAQRLSLPQGAKALALVEEDLAARGDNAFGSHKLYAWLTHEQLGALATKRPSLRLHGKWVSAMLARLAPAEGAGALDEPVRRRAYLDALWGFVSDLAPSFNGLKALVRYHQLALDEREARHDRARFLSYLALPRRSGYARAEWLAAQPADALAPASGEDLRALGLGPVTDDTPLVRAYLEHYFASPGERGDDFAPYVQAGVLAQVRAEARLLAGAHGAEAERLAAQLGVPAAEALRERVELTLTERCPQRLEAGDDATLDVLVKNVAELTVKVFRVDPVAYFLATGAEVDTTLDLDGMVASHERMIARSEGAMVRTRVRVALPECDAPGVYVVELLGNGRSSRALVRRGALACSTRETVAGLALCVRDGAGNALPGATVYADGRAHEADEGGEVVLPFSTQGGVQTVLLAHAGRARAVTVPRLREAPTLALRAVLEREALLPGATATALLNVRLYFGVLVAPVALLEQPRVELTVTDLAGTAVTKTEPLTLADDAEALVRFVVPEGCAEVQLVVRGTVQLVSTQQPLELSASASCALNQQHRTLEVEGLYFEKSVEGYAWRVLGKTGEPRARRPVHLTLKHELLTNPLPFTLATDARGRVALGPLPGISHVSARLPSGASRDEPLFEGATLLPPRVHARSGEVLALPAPPQDLVALYARGGLATPVALRDESARLERRDGALFVDLRELAPGSYTLRSGTGAAGGTELVVLPPKERAPASAGYVALDDSAYELSAFAPTVTLARDGDAVVARVRGAGPRTRVHVFGTRFVAPALSARVPGTGTGALGTTSLAPSRCAYASNRELGDEYRYVLERRRAAKKPGSMLEKPGLLLNPWALRTTSTRVQSAATGTAYAASRSAVMPAAPPPPSAAPSPQARRLAEGASQPASVDFLRHPAAVLANLRPDAQGAVRVPLAELTGALAVRVVVVDPRGSTEATLGLDERERPLVARDLRLLRALDADKHFAEERTLEAAYAGQTLVIEDLRSDRLELIDSLARAHQVLLSLRDDDALREFSFVTRWSGLDDAQRRALYSRYACHELHLFLHAHDRAFFDAVVRPYLANKRVRTLVDRYLLDEDLSAYVTLAAYARLDALERVLLARRVPEVRARVRRWLEEQVAVNAHTEPQRDGPVIDALLGATGLEGGGLTGAPPEPELLAEAMPMEASLDDVLSIDDEREEEDRFGAIGKGGAAKPALRSKDESPKLKKMARGARDEADESDDEGGGGERSERDLDRRRESKPQYRPADTTREWAETHWWRARLSETGPERVAPSRLLRDLAAHEPGSRPFVSPHLADAAGSFTEALFALSALELPFVAAPPATRRDENRLEVTLAGPAIVARTRIAELADAGPSAGGEVLVGQNYLRSDDREVWEDGEHREKFVSGPLQSGVAYHCKVVLTNPTSATRRLSVLLQLPKGAVPLEAGFVTRTRHLALPPYSTHAEQYAFYLPLAGTFSHLPAQVTHRGALLAAPAPRALEVRSEPSPEAGDAWPQLAQRGTLDAVCAHLEGANLARTPLEPLAFRMRNAGAFARITALLAERGVLEPRLWAYALQHRDVARAREWLAHPSFDEVLQQAQSPLEAPRSLVALEAEPRGWLEHLEYAPLLNARAHQLGARRAILNDGLDAHYRARLAYVAHRAAPTSDDLLCFAQALLTMDRVDDAARLLARANALAGENPGHAALQRAYLGAYVAWSRGALDEAKRLAAPYAAHPVERWRARFDGLLAAVSEVERDEASAAASADAPASSGEQATAPQRERALDEAASREPSLSLRVEGGRVLVQHRNVRAVELRYYRMDLELLFSRSPFVQGDARRFGFIAPNHAQALALEGDGETAAVLPDALRGASVVVEALVPGLAARPSVVHYAHDLRVDVVAAFGQLRVARASTQRALPAAYVKVFARNRQGGVHFYKDGYTDPRGRFDFVTLSTDDLDRVERFALLVHDDAAGATVLEAAPPPR